MEIAIGIVAGIVLGVIGTILLTRVIFKSANQKLVESAQLQADALLKEAELKGESLRQKRIAEANEKYQELKEKFEQKTAAQKERNDQRENKLNQRERELTTRIDTHKKTEQQVRDEQKAAQALKTQVDADRVVIENQQKILAQKQEEVELMRMRQVEELEKIAGLSVEEARESMVRTLRAEAQSKASTYVKDILEEARASASKQAKKIIIETIQRTAAEHAIENTITVFALENDEVKGRIIGREGRNIRTLEQLTGVELIVDDTPEAIIISGFDPVRREVARLALHKLVTDGRIHPARIEEVVKKTFKMIEEDIMETGERTVIDLGVHGLPRDLVRLVGKMKYRSSYGQNLLQHSREVANLCETMASELGLDTKKAKRAGLLHDIGKVADEQSDLPHALLGMKIAEKYKEHPEILNAIGAHHDEIEMTSILSPIIQACDAISGSRPGARREIVEGYIQRLKEMEDLAMSYPGVEKTFAIQAGRELRVIVESEKVDDATADNLAMDIALRIQTDMQYPGHIKVTVIREKRAVAYAR